MRTFQKCTWRLPQSLFLFSPSPVVVERTASFLVMDVHICRSTVLCWSRECGIVRVVISMRVCEKERRTRHKTNRHQFLLPVRDEVLVAHAGRRLPQPVDAILRLMLCDGIVADERTIDITSQPHIKINTKTHLEERPRDPMQLRETGHRGGSEVEPHGACGDGEQRRVRGRVRLKLRLELVPVRVCVVGMLDWCLSVRVSISMPS